MKAWISFARYREFWLARACPGSRPGAAGGWDAAAQLQIVPRISQERQPRWVSKEWFEPLEVTPALRALAFAR